MNHVEPHPDLAGWVLGTLDPPGSGSFVDHAAGCRRCRDELAELRPVAARLGQAVAGADPPAALQARTLAAVAHEADGTGEHRSRGRWVWAAAAAAVAAVALVAGSPASRSPAPIEIGLAAVGEAPAGASGLAQLRRSPQGVLIELDVRKLAPSQPGAYYECWYVAADEVPGRPARVSAGTFLVPASGRAAVHMVTAADPRRFPLIEVTVESDGGDPGAGPAVLRSTPRRPRR